MFQLFFLFYFVNIYIRCLPACSLGTNQMSPANGKFWTIKSIQSIATTMNIMWIVAVFFPYNIFSTIFFMHKHLEIAFEIQNTFGSMWILCVVALASAHILMFFCDAIEFQSCCQAHTIRNEENRQEIIWEPHSNIQVLSIFSHFNCVCIHCTRDFTFACVYDCSCVWSCYDFVCEIFSVGNRMLLIILTVKQAER